MGIQSASATFTRFFVPEITTEDFWSFVEEKLQDGIFKDLEPDQEQAAGFASWEDFFESSFPYSSYHKGEYVAFHFRIDSRKVPAMVVKQHVRQAVQKHRDDNDGRWPSRKERQDIQEEVQSFLLNRTFPQPSACEVVWNPTANWMLVGATSARVIESFMEHFEKYFQAYPVPLYHAQWALNMLPLDPSLKDRLCSMVPVKSPTALEEGRFLGHEFLTWLWYFIEQAQGPFLISEEKAAEVHLGERIVLTLPEDGREKVVCTTQANSLHEARTALRQGKLVNELQLFLMVGENEYFLTLDSGLWAVKGLKTPKQLKDYDGDDPDGLFLEKMFFLEEVSAVLNTLYQKFLIERLSSSWESEAMPQLKTWIKGEEAEVAPVSPGAAPF